MSAILFPEKSQQPARIAAIRKILSSKVAVNYRSILARMGGLILLAAAYALLHLFLENPRGTLPGFPQAWSGVPLILGAAFLATYGACLLVKRRVSLAAFIVASLAAGSLATYAHKFVSSVAETTAHDTVHLPSDKGAEFIERSRLVLTPERLQSMAMDAKNSGYLKNDLDFDSASVTYRTTNDCSNVIVTINFSYSPYIYPSPTGARSFVAAYTRLLNSWIAADVKREEDAVAKGTAKALYQRSHPKAYFKDPYENLDLDFLQRMRKLDDFAPEPTRQNLRFAIERESDPKFKEILVSISKNLNELEDNPPPPKPPQPLSRQSRRIFRG